jgi:hypothetical protein
MTNHLGRPAFSSLLWTIIHDEDTNADTSTPAPASPEDTLQATPSGPITQTRACELNYILLLKNEGSEELKPIQPAGGPADQSVAHMESQIFPSA